MNAVECIKGHRSIHSFTKQTVEHLLFIAIAHETVYLVSHSKPIIV